MKVSDNINYWHSYHDIYEIEPHVWESLDHFDVRDLLPSRPGTLVVEVVTVHDNRYGGVSVSDRVKRFMDSYPDPKPILSDMSVRVQTEDNGKFVEIEVSRGTKGKVGFVSVYTTVPILESTELTGATCRTVAEFLKQLFGAIE